MTPVELNQLLMMTCLVATSGALALYVFPKEKCKQCAHCRQEQHAKKQAVLARQDEAVRAREKFRADNHMAWHQTMKGDDTCPYCEEKQQEEDR